MNQYFHLQNCLYLATPKGKTRFWLDSFCKVEPLRGVYALVALQKVYSEFKKNVLKKNIFVLGIVVDEKQTIKPVKDWHKNIANFSLGYEEKPATVQKWLYFDAPGGTYRIKAEHSDKTVAVRLAQARYGTPARLLQAAESVKKVSLWENSNFFDIK